MKNKTSNTPKLSHTYTTKWQGENYGKMVFLADENGEGIGEIYTDCENWKERLDHIVRAVNAYDALLEAAKWSRATLELFFDDVPDLRHEIKNLDDAIAEAEGMRS